MNDDATNDRRVHLRRALVKAGREERVSSELRSRLLATAAAAAVTTATTSSAAEVARTTRPTAPPASASSTTMSAAGTAAAWKTVGILFAIGAVAVSAVSIRTTRTETLTPPVVQSSGSPAPVEAPSAEPAPPAASEAPTLSVDQLRAAPPETPRTKKPDDERKTAKAIPAPDDSSARPANAARLTDEMKRVGEIRAAANDGRPGDALRLLEEYRADFPNGMLAEETEVLRIESLSRLGRTSAAASLAKRFLKERPNSPYVGRIRATLAALPAADD